MPYTIFEDLFDPRSDPDDYDPNDYGPDDYDPDSPCNCCMKESCIGCDIIEFEAYHERLANMDWDRISGIYNE